MKPQSSKNLWRTDSDWSIGKGMRRNVLKLQPFLWDSNLQLFLHNCLVQSTPNSKSNADITGKMLIFSFSWKSLSWSRTWMLIGTENAFFRPQSLSVITSSTADFTEFEFVHQRCCTSLVTFICSMFSGSPWLPTNSITSCTPLDL
jgi:hypothetical protein